MSRTSEEKDLGNWHLYHGHFEAFCSVYQSCSSAARARSILAMVRRNFKRLDCEDLIIGLGHRPISDLMLNMLSIRGLHTSRRIYSVWKSIQRAATRHIRLQGTLLRAKTTFNGVNNIRGEEATRWSHRVLQDFDRKGEHRPTRPHSSSISQIGLNSHGLRGHSLKLSFNRSRLDLRKNSFIQRVIRSVLGTVFLSMSSTPPRLTLSRTASRLDADWKAIGYGQ